jgi:hypothetical protein
LDKRLPASEIVNLHQLLDPETKFIQEKATAKKTLIDTIRKLSSRGLLENSEARRGGSATTTTVELDFDRSQG